MLTISQGPGVTVPNIIGDDLATAEQKLSRLEAHPTRSGAELPDQSRPRPAWSPTSDPGVGRDEVAAGSSVQLRVGRLPASENYDHDDDRPDVEQHAERPGTSSPTTAPPATSTPLSGVTLGHLRDDDARKLELDHRSPERTRPAAIRRNGNFLRSSGETARRGLVWREEIRRAGDDPTW